MAIPRKVRIAASALATAIFVGAIYFVLEAPLMEYEFEQIIKQGPKTYDEANAMIQSDVMYKQTPPARSYAAGTSEYESLLSIYDLKFIDNHSKQDVSRVAKFRVYTHVAGYWIDLGWGPGIYRLILIGKNGDVIGWSTREPRSY